MKCDKLMKEALTNLYTSSEVYKGKTGWIEDDRLYNDLQDTLYKHDELFDTLEEASYITEDEKYLINPSELKQAILDNFPEVKDTIIKRELKKLENIIPTNSYIKTSEYHKYIPDLTDEQKAAYINRQGTGYLNDGGAEQHRDFIVGGKVIYDVNNGKLTKEEALNTVNKVAIEKFNDYSELEDYVYNGWEASQKFINEQHNISKVTIDKDMYVTKAPYFAESYKEMPNHYNVSTLMVNPYDLRSIEPLSNKVGEVFRIPKGSKVNFVVEQKLSKDGRFTEIVLDVATLKKADKMTIQKANRLKDKVIARYKQLGGTDINKLFAITPALLYLEDKEEPK